MAVRNIERALETLSELRRNPSHDERLRELRKALGNRVNVIVAKAAALAGELQLRMLIPDLGAAFDRMLIDAAKSDPQCRAKEAIAKALVRLGHDESAIFLKGARHVQMEPVWGGEEDSATTLRGTCVLALLQCTDLTREDKLWSVMRLLTETSPSLRKDGAAALQSLEGREAALLLRIKARMGDRDPTVTGQVFESLLQVEGEGAVPFLVEFLHGTTDDETREEAALALGASRLPAAVTALKNELEQKRSAVDCEIIFRALSISRSEDALELLLKAVQIRRPREAISALSALLIYGHSTEIRNRIRQAALARSETEIQREYERLFETE